MTHTGLRAVSLLIVVTLLGPSVARQGAAQTVPAGFQGSLVANVPGPTGLAFTPDDRLLVTGQDGRLWVYQGALLPAPALDLRSRVCANSERGLLGVAVDPAFAATGYIYLFYTLNVSGTCAANTPLAPVNRVSRFTLRADSTVNPASELVLLDNIPSPNGNHNGGDLQIGRDGLLYVSVGDGGCDYRGDSGCAGANDAARDRHVLLGKILRITRTGGIPATNPFLGSGTVRCHLTGRASAGQVCQETFAWGLRNPFRIAFDGNAAGTRFFINDVGQNTWEEIDEGIAGADYGWNAREGHCATGTTTNCDSLPPGMTDPVFDYRHASGCASITGGAFVPDGIWPAAFAGAYLFSDYVCGTIFRLSRDAGGAYVSTPFATGLGSSSAVAMTFGPFEDAQALYYTTYANGGQVRRIAWTANRAPDAALTASPRSGPVPLTVSFDARGSTDPDGDALTFAWSFGDGTSAAAGATITHTYSAAGRYTATVAVRDAQGGSDSAAVTIDAGNRAPVPAISAPSATATFSVGQTITLSGAATDPEDGALPPASLSWSVLLHHNTHTHPWFGPAAGNHLTFTAPAPEDIEATASSFLEIRLTATDLDGATATTVRHIQPRRVSVTLQSDPGSLTLNVNGMDVTTPRTITSWAGYQLTVTASTQRDGAGRPWLFAAWSDGGAASHVVVTPATASTLSARFDPGVAAVRQADAFVRGGIYGATRFGTDPELHVKHSTNVDHRRRAFLRFTAPAGDVGRAVLRLRGGLNQAGEVPIGVYAVPDITWPEAAITWNTQPAMRPTALASATVSAAGWYEWDLTAHVRAETAAGRRTFSVALAATAATQPLAVFASGNGATAASRPELLIGADTPPAGGEDVVLWGVDAVRAGAWTLAADATAAGGARLWNPDARAAKVWTPLAAPASRAELTFTAERGRAYRLWIRGQAERNTYANDSVFVQFSDSVDVDGTPVFRIGTTSATVFNLEDCADCGISGWGWQDNGYGAGVLGPLIYFATTGTHTIRLQTREDGLSIDQIVLSPSTYLTASPGLLRNDTTILPRP
jgi:glucose/arabinose dehydrogenase/PKD repeat protein